MKKNSSISLSHVASATLSLKGKKVAIVGGTGGIGQALSRYMASRGADVMVVGQTFRDADTPGITFLRADLASMKEAARVAKLLPSEELDMLVFTTGIFAAPQRQVTAEGIEKDMAVSYLSRLAILRQVGPILGRARGATSSKTRVFVMGYPGTGQIGRLGDLNAEQNYSAMAVHMNTVAGNEILVLDSAKRYLNARFFGLNPGLIKTNIRDNFFGRGSLKSKIMESLIGLLTQSPAQYAERISSILFAPDLEKFNSIFFDKKGNPIHVSDGMTSSHVNRFIEESEALLQMAA
ncbi:SDR family NAD(P)-dependent oxidoreductase [Herbaspirillum robiniae]|uniref:Oxidoreductase n=1 Tax=Herbaspirillum robiniae TaxID=2014887 RepID=A0A246WPA0_9BURK|nr:SDR family NAD(P)-dependent oxidoreductase [Herbaspirillum robiniae]OWY28189.1 oxidoreductase [Herbaspirillum robiniae]